MEVVEVLDATYYVSEGGVGGEVFKDASLLLGGGRFGEGVDYVVCVFDCLEVSYGLTRKFERHRGALQKQLSL